MKLFYLQRDIDESGVSGTGIVAEGVIFTDGRCAMRWLTATASTGLYDSIEQLEQIHGHGGKTKVTFREGEEEHDEYIQEFISEYQNFKKRKVIL
jgi:hypothetical protein